MKNEKPQGIPSPFAVKATVIKGHATNAEIIEQMVEGFAGAVHRRHHGNPNLTPVQRVEVVAEMKALWAAYKKVTKALDYCEGEWWDTMKIEACQFSRPDRFRYAHRKRKKLMAEQEALHRRMFVLLTHTDGNHGQEFSRYHCIGAQDCYLDFISKYDK